MREAPETQAGAEEVRAGPADAGAPFDPYGDSYREAIQDSIAFIGQDVDHFVALKARRLLDLIARHLGDPAGARVLDVGCGVGATDRHLVSHVGELHGVDIAARLVEQAAADVPGARYTVYEGDRLPFDDGSFDVAFCVCVVHHVPEEQWPRFSGELARVLRPGGLAAIFEHNPFNPLTRLAVIRCPFDEDAQLLRRRAARRLLREAGLASVEDAYMVFSPFGGRLAEGLERRLARLPLGAQYYVAGRKPEAGTGPSRI